MSFLYQKIHEHMLITEGIIICHFCGKQSALTDFQTVISMTYLVLRKMTAFMAAGLQCVVGQYGNTAD